MTELVKTITKSTPTVVIKSFTYQFVRSQLNSLATELRAPEKGEDEKKLLKARLLILFQVSEPQLLLQLLPIRCQLVFLVHNNSEHLLCRRL